MDEAANLSLNLHTGHGNESEKLLTSDPASSETEEGRPPCSPLQQDSECSLSGMSELKASGGNMVWDASFVGDCCNRWTMSVLSLAHLEFLLDVVGSSINCYKCRAEFHVDPTCVGIEDSVISCICVSGRGAIECLCWRCRGGSTDLMVTQVCWQHLVS